MAKRETRKQLVVLMMVDGAHCDTVTACSAGFEEVKEVTNEIQYLPDLLVWGGVGTRMDIQVMTATHDVRMHIN